MPTYLHIHKLPTDTVQHHYRSRYEVRHMDYELSRSVNQKGEIISDITGGKIRMVLEGFGDEELFTWLFDALQEEDGEIVTMDPDKRVVEKFTFDRARAVQYRLRFDADSREAVSAVVTIEAGVISTEGELYYNQR
ncbi:MAG: type VI secretion system needle protein Hcp [Bacteroides sp.]|nr:type VI secretion system needle protein Hcp [Bacteroides sp.]